MSGANAVRSARMMRDRIAAVAFAALGSFGLWGCSPPRATEFHAPTNEAEASVFEERRADGVATGRSVKSWRRDGDLWVFSDTKLLAGEAPRTPASADAADSGAAKTTTLWLDDALTLDHASFADGRVVRREGDRFVGEGPNQAAAFAGCSPCVENAISVEALRALELPAPGERLALTVQNVQRGTAIEARVKNVGREPTRGPEGPVTADHLEVSFLTQVHHVWIDGEKRVLRYKNPAGGELVLVAQRRGEGVDPAAFAAELPALPEAPRPAPKVASIVVAGLSQALMVFGPMILAIVLKARWKLSYRLWGLGALAFVASQVVHIPLNYALGILTGGHGAGLWPLPAFSVIAGLSAGTCESVARYLMLRFAIKERDDRTGAFVGAGHGGVESILLGFLAGLGTLNMGLIGFMGAERLGVPKEHWPVLDAALSAFFATPPAHLLSGATERFGAVAFHVLANVMVMRAVARRKLGWLLAAIALHAAIDGGLACFALVELGTTAVAVAVPLLGALFSVALVRMLRAQQVEASG